MPAQLNLDVGLVGQLLTDNSRPQYGQDAGHLLDLGVSTQQAPFLQVRDRGCGGSERFDSRSERLLPWLPSLDWPPKHELR